MPIRQVALGCTSLSFEPCDTRPCAWVDELRPLFGTVPKGFGTKCSRSCSCPTSRSSWLTPRHPVASYTAVRPTQATEAHARIHQSRPCTPEAVRRDALAPFVIRESLAKTPTTRRQRGVCTQTTYESLNGPMRTDGQPAPKAKAKIAKNDLHHVSDGRAHGP